MLTDVHLHNELGLNDIFGFIPYNVYHKNRFTTSSRFIMAPRSFPTIEGRVSGSLLTIRPRLTVLTGGGGWVC